MTAVATATKGELSPVARHIARAAARLFAERGYDATSVREIVEAAGVAKPTLYYYFRSKEGLAQALLTVPLSNLVATLAADRDDGGRPDSRASSRSSRPSTRFAATTPTGPVHLCPALRAARLGSRRRAGAVQGQPARAGPRRPCAGSPKRGSWPETGSTPARPPAAG